MLSLQILIFIHQMQTMKIETVQSMKGRILDLWGLKDYITAKQEYFS